MISPRALLTLGMLAALATAAMAQGKTYKDEDLGFSVKTVNKWDQVPPEPTEKQTVARWASPREIGDLPARMHVHVFHKKGGVTGKKERPAFFNREVTFKSWLKYNRRGADLGKGRKLKIKAPKKAAFTALVHEYERDSGYTRGGRPVGAYYNMVLVVETAHTTYVVEMFVSESAKRKHRGLFNSIAKSFTLLDRKEAVAGAGAGEPGGKEQSPKERARARARKEASKVAGWWYEESENYIILTNLSKRRRLKILTLKKELEAIRAHMEREIAPVRPIEAISIVRVCADRDTYLQYGAPPSSAGYWYAAAEELVLYAEGEKDRTREVLYHEAFHQYIYYAMAGVSPCICLNEGGADYYSGADIKLRKVQKIEKVQSNQERIKTAIRTDKHVPIDKILVYSQREYYARADLCYPQGWSIVYFLKHGLAKKHPWAKIIPVYYDALRNGARDAGDEAAWKVGGIRKTAYDAAFKDVDLKAFEEAWKAFTVSGKIAKP